VVVVCTHAALTTSDLSGYAGWTLLIDEVLDVVACGTWRTGASLAQFRANYGLEPAPGMGAWSRVQVRADAPGPAMVAADDLVGGSTAFHRRAQSRSGRRTRTCPPGRRWSRRGVVVVERVGGRELAAFDRVLLVGNAFSHSLSRRLMAERPARGTASGSSASTCPGGGGRWRRGVS
jgi:hypothetical protein